MAEAPAFGIWNPLFFKGIELFNQKKFFDAHEEWEKLWMQTPKDDDVRDFYKGLIQVAAVFEHVRRHNLEGSAGLLKTCVPYLERYAPRQFGLDLASLLKDLEAVKHEIFNVKKFDAIKPPALKLWVPHEKDR